MSKPGKKPLLGTPGGNFSTTKMKDPPPLSVINESDFTKNNEEMTENGATTASSLKRDYDEKLKFEVILSKTSTATCVRTTAILALSKLLASDLSRQILPYLAHHTTEYKPLNNVDDLPHQEAALRVYVSNPTLKHVPKTNDKLKLLFFVRTKSQKSLTETKRADGNLDWYKENDIYINTMDIESTDNTRIGMLIGKACRITSLPDLKTTIQLLYSNQVGHDKNHDDLPPFHLSNDSIGTVKNQTRTRVVTFTCSKIHTRLLTSILQKLFTATTNYQFLSFPVMSSLSEATQAAILRQHQSRTAKWKDNDRRHTTKLHLPLYQSSY